MKVRMLIRIPRTSESVHIELPDEGRHVLMPKIVWKYFLYKSGTIDDLKTFAFGEPSHDIDILGILSLTFKYCENLVEFSYELGSFSAPVG